MDKKRFWNIIDQSRRNSTFEAEYAADRKCQLEELTDTLLSFSPEELIGFEEQFSLAMRHAYRWDLWAMAYLIGGGCSDDGFDYFRRWLIARGQAIYEAALRDPESLLDVLPEAESEEIDVEFEEFGYVCGSVYEEKTGRDMGEHPIEQVGTAEPFGESWTEEDLPLRFPQAWQRFGAESE